MSKKIFDSADTLKGKEREKFRRRAERMAACATEIVSDICPDCGVKFVKRANLCRDRLCPTCSWRRARALAIRLTRHIEEQQTQSKYLLLTLTIRNCKWENLRKTLDTLTKSWGKFSRWSKFARIVKGYARTVEITSRNGEVHPHVHALLQVPTDYFANADYITQREIVAKWKKVLNVEYTPVCDIRAVKANKINGAVQEVTKYITKNTQVENLSESELLAYARAIAGVRLWSTGGTLRVSEDEVENGMTNDETERKTTCPNCGAPLVEIVERWDNVKSDYEIVGGPPILGTLINFGTIVMNITRDKVS